jgi:hypothetical protein
MVKRPEIGKSAFLSSAHRYLKKKSISVFAGSQVSPVCRFEKIVIEIKMSWWNDTYRAVWSVGGMILTDQYGALVE